MFSKYPTLLQDPEEATCGVNKNVTSKILHFSSLLKWGIRFDVVLSFDIDNSEMH